MKHGFFKRKDALLSPRCKGRKEKSRQPQRHEDHKGQTDCPQMNAGERRSKNLRPSAKSASEMEKRKAETSIFNL
jgi:hypothetical protein